MTLSQVYTCLVFVMLAAPNDARCVPLLHGMACNLKLNTCANNRCAHFAIICPVGSYGLRCKAKCSNHCVESKCHLTERGAEICTKGCVKGWRGIGCLEPCTPPCSECDRHTGSCTDQCGDGLYGDGCTQECPPTCLRCDKTSGECTAVRHSSALLKASGSPCQDGYYGVNCSKRCTSGCETCDQWTGDCLLDETQTGPSTALKNSTDTDQCGDGLYGDGCTQECPPTCLRCDKTSGECTAVRHSSALLKASCSTCQAGYYGVNCSKRCTSGCETCDQWTGDCLLDETQTGPSTALKNSIDNTSSVDKLPEVRSSDVKMRMIIGLSALSAFLLLMVVFQCFRFRTRRKQQITDKEDLKDAHLPLNETTYAHIYDEINEDADDREKQREYLTATFTKDGLGPSLIYKIAASGYLHPLWTTGPHVAPNLSHPDSAPFDA